MWLCSFDLMSRVVTRYNKHAFGKYRVIPVFNFPFHYNCRGVVINY